MLIQNPDFDYHHNDIPTPFKVITTLMSKDRFAEGTLDWAYKSGLMLKILKAIKGQVSGLKN